MPMVFMDARRGGHRITFANDSFLSLLGYARDEVLGQSFDSLMAPGVQPQAWSQVLSAFEDGSDVDREVRYCRKDGTSIWASMRISPVRNQDGVVVQHFASISDLTAHKQEQAELKLLVDELNHRVKNTLSTVQAIVSQALRNSSDLAVVAEAVESRLSSLSRSHDLLTRESWHSAGLADVILAALDPFGVAMIGPSVSPSRGRIFVSLRRRRWRSVSRSTNWRRTPSNMARCPTTRAASG